MTVKELIEELEHIKDPYTEVMFSYNYGDYWKTRVAARIHHINQLPVEYSDYHSMHKLCDEDGKPIEVDGDKIRNVIVLY